MALVNICSLAEARLFVLYGGYVLVNIFSSLWINKNMPCIFPCASTEKSTRLFLCRNATKNPKVRIAGALPCCLIGVSPVAYTEVRTIRAPGE